MVEKVYISSDIEGTMGIANWAEANRNHAAYREFQERMTAETAVSCEAAIAAGVSEIVVKDVHGDGRNIFS